MFSRFFINRPVFAAVVSIVTIIVGLVTLRSIPVAQYPEIAPPVITVRAVYPGANAGVLGKTVAQPIEEEVNGVEGMLYMSSTSTGDGEYNLNITFEVGTNLDMAQVLVQNRVSQAESLLPEEVQRIGIKVEKSSSSILLFAAMTSPDDRFDSLYLSNYVNINIKDEISRLDGVGSVTVFGASDYSMRIWLNPEKMKARGLTTSDVISAIREQNIQVAAGQIGKMPTGKAQDFQQSINVKGRLESVGEFENIILKNIPGHGMVRIKDIARVELGAQTYNISSKTGVKDSAALAVFLRPGANALEVAGRVKTKMAEVSKTFPEGLAYEIPFDTTTFVEASIDEVVETLYIAVVLVIIVILVFLQNWRAAIIPIVTIPVSLIGTFAVMAALGVSINMLSMFGIVLAIGIVVDDAIVVVENVMRNIDEAGDNPRKATIKAMEEVSGPIVATTLVLLAVFIPTAFLGGITGQLYRQFALTIATATVFSAINALTLSPALSALILRPTSKNLNAFSKGFNNFFDKLQDLYGFFIGKMIRKSLLMFVVFLGLTGITFLGFRSLPNGFIPNEDQGWALMVVSLPEGASLQRTKEVVDKINNRLKEMEGVKRSISVSGYSVLDNALSSNGAAVWAVFDPWDERLEKGLTIDAMMGKLWGSTADIQEALFLVVPPPPIMGIGNSSGYDLQVLDKANLGFEALQDASADLVAKANAHPDLQYVFSTFSARVPQLTAEIDRTQIKSLNIPLSNVFNTLQANLGSVYVNDFNKFGRTFQVRVQADSDFRGDPEDIKKLEVRNLDGKMIPLGQVVNIKETLGPQIISRHNVYPSASITGLKSREISSGEALDIMGELAEKTLPKGMSYEWTNMSFQEKAAQGQILLIFSLAVIFIYLVLCAQYESWSLPLTVILAVPLAVLGTVIAVEVRDMDVNVYTQIGLVLLIALTCKTAILISEFAKASRESGLGILESSYKAATLRFRPILMTAATFILGIFPLVIATGAGAAGRQALGTAVFSGMISATLLLIFFVPAFYVFIQQGSESFSDIFAHRKKEMDEK